MDTNFSVEDASLRSSVRVFLKENLPARLAAKVRDGQPLTKNDQEEWHAILHRRGWLASHWPESFGGTGWGPARRFIFELECAIAYAPRIVPFGVNMLGPVLIKFGNEGSTVSLVATDLGRLGLVVPGIFGAGGGLGSRCPQNERQAGA